MNNLNKPMMKPTAPNNVTSMPHMARPVRTVIDASTKINGNITSKSEVVVHGVIIGDIQSNKVNIGSNAMVTGVINAAATIISGQFDGKIIANSVELKATSSVTGEIQQKTIIVDSGAKLDVNIQTMS